MTRVIGCQLEPATRVKVFMEVRLGGRRVKNKSLRPPDREALLGIAVGSLSLPFLLFPHNSC